MTFMIEIKNIERNCEYTIFGALAVEVSKYNKGSDEFLNLKYRTNTQEAYMEQFSLLTIDELFVRDEQSDTLRVWVRGEDGKFSNPYLVKFPLVQSLDATGIEIGFGQDTGGDGI